VTESWQLLTGDLEERRRFGDLAATLALPWLPCGPPNRLRSVARLQHGDGVWFLKTFTRTQWQNRLRFLCTAPRAHSDAEREWRVTAALRAAGEAAPVPVAWGRQGARSFYLCRELPGRAFAEHLAAGSADAAMARELAAHCGRLLRLGFRLPDLSADHVFVGPGNGGCAVLDLHNGGLARPGPVPLRLLRRVLRHFARSARLLPVGAVPALRFAVRLLRAAGRAEAVRAVLRRLPPWRTAARYETPGKSAAYRSRNPARDAREQALLARVWPGRPGETVLDLPCGTGRLLPLLHGRCGHRVLQADGAFAMLRAARAQAAPAAPAVAADALAMPFADRAVDGIVMFRFLHHLPGPERARALAEACRVARRFVVVSFFHPCSVHQLRRLWHRLCGRPARRFCATLGQLERSCGRHGFALRSHAAELPYARDLWLACFERR